MNESRRLILQEIQNQIDALEKRVHDLWLEEERDYEARSLPSKSSSQGEASKAAIEYFDTCVTALSDASEAIAELTSK
jgi:hypothetical protein